MWFACSPRRRDGNKGPAGDVASMVLFFAAMPFVYRLGRFTPWTTVEILATYTYCFFLSHAPLTKHALQALFGRGVGVPAVRSGAEEDPRRLNVPNTTWSMTSSPRKASPGERTAWLRDWSITF